MPSMEFDEVLENIGDIGAYQITLFFMLGAFEFMTADVVAMNFIGGYQPHWCNVPALANFSFDQQQYISLPLGDRDRYSNCEVYNLNWDSYTEQDFYNWTRDDYNDTPTIKCEDFGEGWTVDRSELVHTIRSDFDLWCDNSWKGEFVSSIYMLGILVGAFLGGLMSDLFGRKKAFLGSLLVKFVGNMLSTHAPSYWVFLLGRFITGGGGMGSGVAVYVLIGEFTLSKWRCILGVLWFTIWSLTYAIMPWIAWFLRDWYPLMAVYTWPLIVFLLYIPFLDESPRWLISKERFTEATAIIEKIAAINRTKLPEGMTLSGAPSVEKEKVDDMEMVEEVGKVEEVNKGMEVQSQREEGNRGGNFFDLFKTPNLRKKTFIIYLCWFTNNLIYYGLSLNSGALAGDVYINTFLLGLIEIPANILCFLFSNWIGRTWTIGLSLLLAAAASIIQIPLILVGGMDNAVTAMSIIGKAGVTSSFSGIYVLTSEIFPTGIRNVGLGSASMCARISGILAPYMGEPMIKVWPALPSLIFGAFALLAGLTTLLLPETLNQPLPETIEQAEAFGKKPKKGAITPIEDTEAGTLPAKPDNMEMTPQVSSDNQQEENQSANDEAVVEVTNGSVTNVDGANASV